VISKRKLVNTLFTLAFPLYGVGAYLMFSPGKGFSIGLFFATAPFLLILLFYGLDLLYRGSLTPRVNSIYGLCMAALLSIAFSVQLGLHYNSPVLNPINRTVLMLLFLVPFNAAVVVQVYNRDQADYDFAWHMMKALLLLIGLNLAGYAAGMRNLLHSFDERISFPFVMGIYDSAHLLAFVNLILLGYMKDFTKRPMHFLGFTAVYLINLAVIMSVNSRLSFMIFFVLTILFITKAAKATRGLFTISLFTMPLLMSFALLIYEVLSLPFFVAILSRVDKKDVTTFNGRTYIWESAWDWVMDDRRGLLFGNGYNGQYRIRLLEHVAKLWNEPGSYNLHMHSAFLEILVNQGLVGLFLMYMVYWHGFKRYRLQYVGATAMAPLFAGFTYLMFAWQIDIFGYGFYMGFLLLFMLMAPWAVRSNVVTAGNTPLPA
jgi:hypothetical protein